MTIKHIREPKQCQSTHPRRVRRFLWPQPLVIHCVSIHAPRRVRRMVVTVTTIRRMFQSTHPRRVRRMASPVIWLLPCFNPRTHAGCDFSSGSNTAPPALFQSTHPRRVRPSTARPWPRWCHANPRTHAGCDALVEQGGKISRVSIHAPTQVRRCAGRCAASGVVSIHAPTQGATRWTPGQRQRLGRFNPRTHAGCDCLFVTPSYSQRDVCEPHPGQFKTPRCRHHLS